MTIDSIFIIAVYLVMMKATQGVNGWYNVIVEGNTRYEWMV